MDEAGVALADYKSSYRHLAWCFRRSRDNWKNKHRRLKGDHDRLRNQLRSVTASRERHEQAARQAALKAEGLRLQVDDLRRQLLDARDGSEKRGPLPACLNPGSSPRRRTPSPPA